MNAGPLLDRASQSLEEELISSKGEQDLQDRLTGRKLRKIEIFFLTETQGKHFFCYMFL